MAAATPILRSARIWLILAVLFADSLLFWLTHVPWNCYWLFAIGCWSFLNVYWSLAARNAVPVSGGKLHFSLFVAEFLLYGLPLSSLPILGQRFIPRYTAMEILGAVLCAFGVSVAIWSRHVLAQRWSPVITLRDSHELVQKGPYAMIRHPIYFGFIMSTVGMILVLGEVRALVLLLDIGVFFWRIKPEERILRATYPNEYPEYERRVKRLLPCIW